jgi:hypothetical protein
LTKDEFIVDQFRISTKNRSAIYELPPSSGQM